MSSVINIQPAIDTNTISAIEIKGVDVKLFEGAQIYVDLNDSNGFTVKKKVIQMPKSAYDNWLDDDVYLVDYVLAYLEYQKI